MTPSPLYRNLTLGLVMLMGGALAFTGLSYVLDSMGATPATTRRRR